MKDLITILPSKGNLTKTGWELPSTLTKEQWIDYGSRFAELGGAVQWGWGDWWNSGNFEHGERKRIVESDSWNGLAYETLKNYGVVAEFFEMSHRCDLSFKHHMSCSSLPIDEALKVLDWAVENKSSTRATVDKVKEIKAWLAQGWTTDQVERKELIEQGITVVASKRANKDGKIPDAALIAWADQQGLMTEIGRTTKWGNPFEIGDDGDRNEVCDNHRDHYLPFKHKLNNQITELKGKVLVCWCYPERCHGDHLKDLANE